MSALNLVDSHCHLDDQQFDPDRSAVIDRARAAGVKYMLAIGTGDGPPDLTAALRLAEQYDFIYSTVGIHPNDSPKARESTFEDLSLLLRHPKVRAVGEIGLDYHWGVPKDQQLAVFHRQLDIAEDARMPVIIHTRDAWNDTLTILRERWASTGLPCVLHCFTGTAQQARECLDMGFILAYGGISTYPKSAEIREAVSVTPSGQLLLETDCPYLAPVPHRGKRNEPAYVANTASFIADLRGVALDELAASTTSNFERVFVPPRLGANGTSAS